jgi:very-short-patch-repair endonuclease
VVAALDIVASARRLRRDTTDAERLLWKHLRARQLGGYKFRRQHPFGRYVLAFYCESECLGVELDGGQHGELAGERADAVRTVWLESQGCRVIRFWNTEVLQNMDGVLETILRALKKERIDRK